MDMKRILQAMDVVTNKPVEGADSMARFLRVVKEAEQVPAMPDITGLQVGQTKDLGQGTNVTVNKDGTVSYGGGWGVYVYNGQGQHIKTQSPSFAGYSQEVDPTGKITQQNYNQGPLNLQKGTQGTTASYNLAGQELQTKLNEGANPHKVTLPVQMVMQHYQQAESTTASNKTSLFKKYFHQVESEVNEQSQAKRQLVNQYASVIAERVLMKESKNKLIKEESDEESERRRFPHYYELKDKTIFRIPDNESPNGYRDVSPDDDEWDSIYQQEFPDHPIPKETGGFYIGKHPLVKGPDSQDQDVGEMATHLRNDPDGHTLIPHGGMGSGKEETWKSVSTRKLQQVIDMINSGNYTGAEHVLYKNGFLEGAVKALARYEEFKTKQGKRPLAKGKELEIGESVMPAIKAKNPTTPKVVKPKAKTSVCKAGQVQTGTQVKDGKTVPKCSVRTVK